MFDHKHYVPILKGREGEYAALQTLSPEVKSALTPLVEIPPIAWDFAEEKPTKSIDDHLEKVGEKLECSWQESRPFFLDLLWISETERMKGMFAAVIGTNPARHRGKSEIGNAHRFLLMHSLQHFLNDAF
jgi:hypothetical protein